MTAARPYKKTMTAVAAREELVRNAGTQFDPTVCRAFLNISLGRLWRGLGFAAWLGQLPLLAPFVGTLSRWGGQAASATATVAGGAVLAAAGVLALPAISIFQHSPVVSRVPASPGTASAPAPAPSPEPSAAPPTGSSLPPASTYSPSGSGGLVAGAGSLPGTGGPGGGPVIPAPLRATQAGGDATPSRDPRLPPQPLRPLRRTGGAGLGLGVLRRPPTSRSSAAGCGGGGAACPRASTS